MKITLSDHFPYRYLFNYAGIGIDLERLGFSTGFALYAER